PDALVATWSLANITSHVANPVLKGRVDEAQDAASMILAVKPDIHYLQTSAQDWGRLDLPPYYIKKYEPFIKQIRKVAPNLPIGVQANIDAAHDKLRPEGWFNKFKEMAKLYGYSATTAYEYHTG